MPLDRVNWGNYDLVVIDESHNFRNADFAEERETRYQRLMRQVIREGVKTKVLMLSATPVNNRFNDLRTSSQLAYEGESEHLAAEARTSRPAIEEVFREAQRVFNEWSKLPAEAADHRRDPEMLDFDFFELLDAVTIARSRKHIQTFYDTTDIGAFPERRHRCRFAQPLTDLPTCRRSTRSSSSSQSLTLAVYAPLAYVFPSRMREVRGDLRHPEASTAAVGNLGQREPRAGHSRSS